MQMSNCNSTFFLQNGTTYQGVLTKNIQKQFYIQQISNGKYIYDGDSALYEINSLIAELKTKFIKHIFGDIDSYYKQSSLTPIFISELGLSSSTNCTKDYLIKMIDECQKYVPNLYEHLYLEDINFILSSIQNLIIGMNYDFIHYFKNLILAEVFINYNNGTYMIGGETANLIQSMLGSYFVKAHSILDLLTKVAFELESTEYDFSGYPKLKCSNILFGSIKKLKINNSKSTIFNRDQLINTIESLRNEIIHNGSWEIDSKVFVRIENYEIKERFVCFPDMQNGNWTKYKNRYHFFGSENTVNDILPLMHIEYLNRICATISVLINI